MKFEIEDIVRQAAPGLEEIIVTADVVNPPTSDELWAELTNVADKIRHTFQMDMINKRPAIAATRQTYKALGKEPNRYRPSAEALCRRCVKGLELYRTLTIIDLINLISIETGHSIGGFDLDKVEGDTLRLGRGQAGEPYEAIGRGMLNIEGLPVIRDAVGGIGTPTSDNDRTKLSEETTRLLMTINMYGKDMPTDEVKQITYDLLTRYASARNITFTHYYSSDNG